MIQVIRFFHIRPSIKGVGVLSHGGATVRVEGEANGLAVRVQIAYCSTDDQFCRKTGRENAAKSSTVAIPLKGLPGLLKKVARKVLKQANYVGAGPVPKNWRQVSELAHRDWSFCTKYWAPLPAKEGDGFSKPMLMLEVRQPGVLLPERDLCRLPVELH